MTSHLLIGLPSSQVHDRRYHDKLDQQNPSKQSHFRSLGPLGIIIATSTITIPHAITFSTNDCCSVKLPCHHRMNNSAGPSVSLHPNHSSRSNSQPAITSPS